MNPIGTAKRLYWDRDVRSDEGELMRFLGEVRIRERPIHLPLQPRPAYWIMGPVISRLQAGQMIPLDRPEAFWQISPFRIDPGEPLESYQNQSVAQRSNWLLIMMRSLPTCDPAVSDPWTIHQSTIQLGWLAQLC